MRSVVNVTDIDLDGGKIAIKFWAPWCNPCRVMNDIINPLCEEYAEIDFVSVDIAQIPVLAQKFKIKTIPSLLLISEGEEISRIIGAQTSAQLRKELNKFLGKEESVESDVSELEKAHSSEEELTQAASG